MRTLLAVLALALIAPAGAAALDPPQLYIGQPQTEADVIPERYTWTPMEGATANSFVVRLGVGIQPNPESDPYQWYLSAVTGVPDGSPDQPNLNDGVCRAQTEEAGAIGDHGPFDYEENGRYRTEVSVYSTEDRRVTRCQGGPTTRASFEWSLRTEAAFAGDPLARVQRASGDEAFHGLRVSAPTGATGMAAQCATRATVGTDGSLSGKRRTQVTSIEGGMFDEALLFPVPGRWTCVARSWSDRAHGRGTPNSTPWSPPATRLVKEPLVIGNLFFKLRGKGVNVVRARADRFAAGGRITLTATPEKKCRLGVKAVHDATKVRPDGRVAFKLRIPRSGAYRFTLAFAGRRLVLPADLSYGVLRPEGRRPGTGRPGC